MSDEKIVTVIPYWNETGSFRYETEHGTDLDDELLKIGFKQQCMVGDEGDAEGYLWDNFKIKKFIVSYWTGDTEQFTWYCDNQKEAMECWKQVVDLCLAQLRVQREKKAWDKENE